MRRWERDECTSVPVEDRLTAEQLEAEEDARSAVFAAAKLTRRKGKPVAGRCRKIRLLPTAKQRQFLQLSLDAVRWTYNRALDLVAGRDPATQGPVPKKAKALRALCINDEAFPADSPHRWVLGVPQDIRDGGMRDALDAHKACEAKAFKNEGKKGMDKFVIKHRSAKQKSQTFVIPSKHWGKRIEDTKKGRQNPNLVFRYAEIFTRDVLRAVEPLPEDIEYDCRIQKTRFGRFYLCLAMAPVRHHDSEASDTDHHPHAGVIALDPGVMTFQTGYDPSGQVFEFGRRDMGRIDRLGWHVDVLMRRAYERVNSGKPREAPSQRKRRQSVKHKTPKHSQRHRRDRARQCIGKPKAKRPRRRNPPATSDDQTTSASVVVVPEDDEEPEFETLPETDDPHVLKHRQRYRMRRLAQRLRDRAKNLIVELHRKLALWLCRNYRIVLLPNFRTGQMVTRLKSRTARQMLDWRHFQFKQRLLHKASEHPWCKVLIVEEPYTSKTCGMPECGRIYDGLTCAQRTWRCPHCRTKHDRDNNAGRNIALRYLTVEAIDI